MQEKNPAAVALGKIRSERKTEAARQNAKQPRPNRTGKPLASFACECQCSRAHDAARHLSTCPLGRALKRRKK